MKELLWRHYLLLIFIVLICIPSVSATVIPTKDFDSTTNTVTYYDWAGLDKIGTVQLNTPLVYYVIAGKDRKVFEFTVNLDNSEYKNFLSKMELINKNIGSGIERKINYRYKSYEYSIVDTPVYKQRCFQNENKTQSCVDDIVGYEGKTVRKDVWIPLEKLDIQKGEIVIGGFTDVLPNDNVEWIPTIFGSRTDEFAVWTSSMNLGLKGVWSQNESSGTNSQEAVYSGSNGTHTNTPTVVNGIIGNARHYITGSSQYTNILTPSIFDLQGAEANFTISLWVNITNYDADYFIISRDDESDGRCFALDTDSSDTGYVHWDINAGGAGMRTTASSATFTKSAWQNIVLVYHTQGSASNVTLYVNGVWIDDNQGGTVMSACSGEVDFGRRSYSGSNVYYTGDLDEVMLWNRSMSATEVSGIYDAISTGHGWDSNPSFRPEVNLTSPVNWFNSSNSVTFNCTANGTSGNGNGVLNLTLLIDGNDNYTIENDTVLVNLSLQKTLNFDEGLHNWSCRGANEDGYTKTTNRTVRIDKTPPIMSITYPVNKSMVNHGIMPISINFSASDALLELGTCYYSKDNGAWTLITCNSNLTGQTFEAGDHHIGFMANDSVNNIANTSLNFSVFEIISSTYDSFVISGTTHEFSKRINVSENVVITGDFWYNGTKYSSNKTSGGAFDRGFNYSLTIPDLLVLNDNTSFIWAFNMTYNGLLTRYNETAVEINVSQLRFNLCNTTIKKPFLNFSFKNETDNSKMNGTIPLSTWTYWNNDTTDTSTHSYLLTNLSHNYEYALCAFPDWTGVYVNGTLQYSHTETATFPQRIWKTIGTGQLLTNTTNHTTLYLLDSTNGQTVSWQVINALTLNGLSSVVVDAERQIGGIWTLIETKTTDSSGIGAMFMSPYNEYRITFSRTGYTTAQEFIFPTQTSYTRTMYPSSNASTEDFNAGTWYQFLPIQTDLNQSLNYTFGFNISTTTYTITFFGFNVTNSSLLFHVENSTTNGGFLSESLNTSSNETFTVTGTWTINGTTYQASKVYYISSGTLKGYGLKTFFNDLKVYVNSDSGLLGLDNKSLNILVFLFIFIITGIVSSMSGIYSPYAIGLIATSLSWLFSVVGLLNPLVAVFATLLTIALIIKEFTSY